MRRRQFVAIATAGAAFSPLVVRAQKLQARIGLLIAVGQTPEYTASVAAFEQMLGSRGWKKDENLHIDVRWSAGSPQRTQTVIDEIVALQPDVILGQSEAVIKALQHSVPKTPIVFVHVADPVASGFAASLANPGGNITGFTNTTPLLAAKWLELLKEVAPSTKHAVMIFNPDTAAGRGEVFLKPFLSAGPSMGVTTTGAEVHSALDIEQVLTALGAKPGAGLIAIPDPFLAGHSKEIVAHAQRLHLPAVFPYRYYAAQGGLMSYGVNNQELFQKAATYVDRILKGATPAELPIQEPTKFELVINTKTAKELALTVPNVVLGLADELIE